MDAVPSFLTDARACQRRLHERQELVRRGDGHWIQADDPQFSATRQLAKHVPNRVAFLRHRARAGHIAHVHECRRAEVALPERDRDAPEMISNGANPRAIVAVPLKLDPSSVGSIIEYVDRRILIHTHGDLAALLHGGEAGVLGGRGWSGERQGNRRDGAPRQTSMVIVNHEASRMK
jgi:hypothetical protein